MYRAAEDSFKRSEFQVGQRVGIFTIQSIEPNELIAGEDDKHLDFRVSVFKVRSMVQRAVDTGRL